MLIFSVSFQFYRMIPEGNPRSACKIEEWGLESTWSTLQFYQLFQRGWNHQLVKLCRCFCWWSMIFNNPGGWFSLLQILVELAGPILPWLWHAWWASLLWSSGRTCGKDKGWKPHLAFNLQSIQIALLPASIFFEKRWPLWKVHWWFHMISIFFGGGPFSTSHFSRYGYLISFSCIIQTDFCQVSQDVLLLQPEWRTPW